MFQVSGFRFQVGARRGSGLGVLAVDRGGGIVPQTRVPPDIDPLLNKSFWRRVRDLKLET